MTDSVLRDALSAASGRGARNAGVLGGGTFLMGALAGLCGLLRVEPAMRHWRPGMWAAYGGMTCFFLGVGALVVVSALFVMPRRGREVVDRVFQRPDTIARVWLRLVKSRYNQADRPGQLGVGTSLCFDTTDGRHYQIVVPGAQAEALLDAVVVRVPGVKVGPPGGA